MLRQNVAGNLYRDSSGQSRMRGQRALPGSETSGYACPRLLWNTFVRVEGETRIGGGMARLYGTVGRCA